MYIRSIQVENYKSFYKSQEIKFEKGINLVVGKNNVGKSALLEIIGNNYSKKPHKSIFLKENDETFNKESSPRFILSIALTKDEIPIYLPNSRLMRFYNSKLGELAYKVSITWELSKKVMLEESKRIENKLNNSQETLISIITDKAEIESDSIILPEEQISFSYQEKYFFNFLFEKGIFKYDKIFGSTLYTMTNQQVLHDNIYMFNAERKNHSTYLSGSTSTKLENDTSNLAEVLGNLQNNRPRVFDDLVEWVSDIFPEIYHISIQNKKNKSIEIMTWTNPKSADRNDLNISLNESGKGVGQVLSILYVVLSSKTPQVILIDEPQSFLHPSAIRLLIDIFSLYDQHQYIIATHSPIIISYAEAKTIHVVSKNKGVSEVKTLDRKAKENILEAFESVGAQLSDYYGSNYILWVEGPTEQSAFRIIIRQLIKKSLKGITILPVLHTGDFEGGSTKDKKKIIQIYNKLSETSELLPPAIGFVFDKEVRSEQALTDLKKLGKISFIKRRMYENYLLIPEAIATRINSVLDNEKATEEVKRITKEEVEKLINTFREDSKYWKKVSEPQRNPWKTNIDAAKLLTDIYGKLTHSKIEYRKTVESIELTKIIIKEFPEELNDLKVMLESILRDAK